MSLIDIDQLVPNPYRDFDRYPLDEKRIATLLESIDGLSFWGGVTARPDPGGDQRRFEIGGGHHRVEAYKRARAKNPQLGVKIEVCVEGYTDLQMAQIQAVENLSQGGNGAAPLLDAIGGLYEVAAYTVLSGGTLAEIYDKVAQSGDVKGARLTDASVLGQLQSGRGLGPTTFLKLLPSGSASHEQIEIALKTIKDGGLDVPIMTRVHDRITRENAEREAEEHRKTEEAERQRAAAEARRKEAEAKAERKAKDHAEREDRRRKEAEERQARLAEEAERKAAEKAEKDRQAEEARQRREEHRREREELARFKAEEKTKADAEKKAKSDEQKQRQARENAARAKKAAEDRPKTIDPRVSSQLGWTNYHIRTWNRAVGTNAAQKYIPRAKHFELATAINEKADALAQDNENFEMTAKWIGDQVQLAVEQAIGIQRDVTALEKTAVLQAGARNRVFAEYTRMRKACRELRAAGLKLRDLQQEYLTKDLGDFPYDGDTFELLLEARDALNTILRMENAKWQHTVTPLRISR